jgi:hypothetical protein
VALSSCQEVVEAEDLSPSDWRDVRTLRMEGEQLMSWRDEEGVVALEGQD